MSDRMLFGLLVVGAFGLGFMFGRKGVQGVIDRGPRP